MPLPPLAGLVRGGLTALSGKLRGDVIGDQLAEEKAARAAEAKRQQQLAIGRQLSQTLDAERVRDLRTQRTADAAEREREANDREREQENITTAAAYFRQQYPDLAEAGLEDQFVHDEGVKRLANARPKTPTPRAPKSFQEQVQDIAVDLYARDRATAQSTGYQSGKSIQDYIGDAVELVRRSESAGGPSTFEQDRDIALEAGNVRSAGQPGGTPGTPVAPPTAPVAEAVDPDLIQEGEETTAYIQRLRGTKTRAEILHLLQAQNLIAG